MMPCHFQSLTYVCLNVALTTILSGRKAHVLLMAKRSLRDLFKSALFLAPLDILIQWFGVRPLNLNFNSTSGVSGLALEKCRLLHNSVGVLHRFLDFDFFRNYVPCILASLSVPNTALCTFYMNKCLQNFNG